ncbi:MAG: TonB family protein [Candidatus Baltobacteraceae bacterium]
MHLAVAALVHPHPAQAAPEQLPEGLHIIRLALPKSTPTPQPPKPHPVTPQRAVSNTQQRLPVHLVRTHNRDTAAHHIGLASAPPGTPAPSPSSSAAPDVTATGVPQRPTPTPKPACSAPDVAASAVDAVTPQAPPDAQGIAAQVKVKVDLDAAGNVSGAAIYGTSGNQQLDMAALHAAKASRYAPEERACKNIPGSYLFTVDFQE